MKSKEILDLYEAYKEIQINEYAQGGGGSGGALPFGLQRAADSAVGAIGDFGRRVMGKPPSPSSGARKPKPRHPSLTPASSPKDVPTHPENRMRKEEVDIYDIILSHLLDEGYAETPEAAEVIMVNMSEEWVESIVEEVLDEAEGSYGQTPQSTKRWNKATVSRMNKPASEYPKRGDKKKEVEKYSKHNQRTMSLDHDASRGPGKKSSRGSGGRLGLKMTQKDRDNVRGQAQYGHTGYDSGLDGGPSAPGSKPKGKKLERQRKTGVSAD